MIQEAQELLKKCNYAEAQKLFSQVLDQDDLTDSNEIEVFFSLANIFHINGEIGRAIKTFNKVLELDPAHTDASISLSVLYNDIGHYSQAKKVFETASSRVKSKGNHTEDIDDQHINKKFASKHYEIAELYFAYQRFDEALFEYNKVIKLNPEFIEARLKVAKVYAKKKFMNKAFDELRKIKNEYPNYLPARNALGILYYGDGRVLEAQDEWNKVLAREPSNKEASTYMNLSKTATEVSII